MRVGGYHLLLQSLLACTAFYAFAPNAHADTITEKSATYNQDSFNSHGNLDISLAQFDPSLGTLESATVSLVGTSGPQLELLNLGPLAGTGRGYTSVYYTLSGYGANAQEVLSSGLQTLSVPGGSGNKGLLGGQHLHTSTIRICCRASPASPAKAALPSC